MPSFRYTAIDAAGQTVRGEMEAATEAAVVSRLQRQGYIPVRAEPAGTAASPTCCSSSSAAAA